MPNHLIYLIQHVANQEVHPFLPPLPCLLQAPSCTTEPAVEMCYQPHATRRK